MPTEPELYPNSLSKRELNSSMTSGMQLGVLPALEIPERMGGAKRQCVKSNPPKIYRGDFALSEQPHVEL